MLTGASITTAHGSAHCQAPVEPFTANPVHILYQQHYSSLLSKPIITVPRPPSLHLEDPWVAICISSVILACLHLHSPSPIWEVCPLMR